MDGGDVVVFFSQLEFGRLEHVGFKTEGCRVLFGADELERRGRRIFDQVAEGGGFQGEEIRRESEEGGSEWVVGSLDEGKGFGEVFDGEDGLWCESATAGAYFEEPT